VSGRCIIIFDTLLPTAFCSLGRNILHTTLFVRLLRPQRQLSFVELWLTAAYFYTNVYKLLYSKFTYSKQKPNRHVSNFFFLSQPLFAFPFCLVFPPVYISLPLSHIFFTWYFYPYLCLCLACFTFYSKRRTFFPNSVFEKYYNFPATFVLSKGIYCRILCVFYIIFLCNFLFYKAYFMEAKSRLF